MKALLLKYFYVMKRSLYYVTVLSFTVAGIGSVISIEEFGVFYIAFTGVIINIFATETERLDHATAWDIYQAALPISEKDIISARFVWGLIVFGYSCLHVTLPYFTRYIISLFSDEIGFNIESIFRAISVMALALIVNGIIFTVKVIYGRNRMEIIELIAFAILILPAYFICDRAVLTVNFWVMSVVVAVAFTVYALFWRLPFMLYKRRKRA